MSAPLLISSAGDMLAKARYDLQTMQDDLNAYTVFNYFVTCYHISDYVKGLDSVSPLTAFRRDPDFQTANFICNRGKHFKLDRSNQKNVDEVLTGSMLGLMRLGAVRLGEPIHWRLYIDGNEVDPVELAGRLVDKWEQFFRRNNIPW